MANVSAQKTDQRSLKNAFVKPREQFQFVMLFLAGSIVVMTGYTVIFLNSMKLTIDTLAAESDASPAAIAALKASLSSSVLITTVFATVIAAAMVAVGYALSHRIFGPAVQIKRTIENFKVGDYTYRGSLRKRDAFHDVMDDLNSLGAALENKHGPGTKHVL